MTNCAGEKCLVYETSNDVFLKLSDMARNLAVGTVNKLSLNNLWYLLSFNSVCLNEWMLFVLVFTVSLNAQTFLWSAVTVKLYVLTSCHF